MGHQPCPNTLCDAYIGFFADTIALSPVTGGDGAAIGKWVEANARIGGMKEFNGYLVTFRPTLPVMSMTVEIPSAG